MNKDQIYLDQQRKIIARILSAKFPLLEGILNSQAWKEPISEEAMRYFQESEALKAILQEKTLDELEIEWDSMQAEEAEKKYRTDTFDDKFRFFNKPTAKADFKLYIDKHRWTSEVAVALSLGKNPKVVNSESLKEFQGHSPFVDDYIRRLEIINEHEAFINFQDGVRPRELISIVISGECDEINLPEELIQIYRKNNSIVDYKLLYENARREIEILKENVVSKSNDEGVSALQLIKYMQGSSKFEFSVIDGVSEERLCDARILLIPHVPERLSVMIREMWKNDSEVRSGRPLDKNKVVRSIDSELYLRGLKTKPGIARMSHDLATAIIPNELSKKRKKSGKRDC